MAENIFRKQTEQEKDIGPNKGGFLDITTWQKNDYMTTNTKILDEYWYKTIHTDRVPMCFKCGMNAIKDKHKEVERQITIAKTKKKGNINIDINIDFKQFKGEKQFERLPDEIIRENIVKDGYKTEVEVGVHRNYYCKECGSGLTMDFLKFELDAKEKKEVDSKK